MKKEYDKELVSKIIEEANKIKDFDKGKYFTIPKERIELLAEIADVTTDEMIEIIGNYFKPEK